LGFTEIKNVRTSIFASIERNLEKFHEKEEMHKKLLYVREKMFLYAKGADLIQGGRKVFYELIEIINEFGIAESVKASPKKAEEQ